MKRFAFLFFFAFSATCASGMGWAQSFPVKPIRTVIGYPPGGFTDLTLRRVASAMSLGQPVVIENRPGAQTMISVQAVIDATPDGHTLGFVTAALTQNQTQMKAWTIDPVKQLAPVSVVLSLPLLLYVNPSKAGVRSLEEFISQAKSAAKPVIFASSGGSDALPMEHFKSLTGIDMDIVN